MGMAGDGARRAAAVSDAEDGHAPTRNQLAMPRVSRVHFRVPSSRSPQFLRLFMHVQENIGNGKKSRILVIMVTVVGRAF